MNHRVNIANNIMNRVRLFESTAAANAKDLSTVAASDRAGAGNRLENRQLASGSGDMMMSSPPPGVQTDADGLILPKKIVNPCLESTDRKQLHRELKFNTKVGKSVLNQKTELQRAYEKQRERQQHGQTPAADAASPTCGFQDELSRVIMERAQKQEQPARPLDADDDGGKQYVNPEYLMARAKLRAGQRTDLK